MKKRENESRQGEKKSTSKTVGINILRLVISLILIAAGIAGARFLIATKPTAIKRPPAKIEPLVRTETLQPTHYTMRIPAMGNVVPAREISLEAQVAGEVIYLHPEFTEGGMLSEGEKILQINPRDYELAIQQKQRALAEAEYSYKLEQGRQDVARREWNLLYGNQDINEAESDLALRKPHLERVQAEIKAARAELEQAKLNLARTTLTAPFNVQVINKYVDLGSQVTSQEKIADLAGTDLYWVKISLPVERLRWVRVPNGQTATGSKVKIIYRQDKVREGRVARLLPDLSKEGRMARLLIEVKDPLGLQKKGGSKPVLLIGEYVRVEMEGEELRDVFVIPRSALRGDSDVWIIDADSKLEIRKVKTLWRDENSVVFKDGFNPGELLVTSDLAAPVEGMTLRIEQEDEKQQASAQKLPESKSE